VTLTIGINPAIQFFTKRQNFKVLSWIPCASNLMTIINTIIHLLDIHTGYYIIWIGFLVGCVWMAYFRFASWIIWVPCALQWFLAYTCRLPSKDTSIRLAFAATIHQIVAGSLPWKACPCLNLLCLSFFLFVCELTTIQLWSLTWHLEFLTLSSLLYHIWHNWTVQKQIPFVFYFKFTKFYIYVIRNLI
jgi:hypothetical protein